MHDISEFWESKDFEAGP